MTSPTWQISERATAPDSARLPNPYAREGFTLLELLLAIALMGMLLGLTLPRVGAVKSAYFATEEAERVANAIRAARLDAVSGRTTVALTITTGDRSLLERRRLEVQSWHAGDAAGLVSGSRSWRGVWDAPVVGSTAVSGHLRFASAEPGILFFANGSSTGGEVMIHDDDGELRHHFRVEPATGELFARQ